MNLFIGCLSKFRRAIAQNWVVSWVKRPSMKKIPILPMAVCDVVRPNQKAVQNPSVKGQKKVKKKSHAKLDFCWIKLKTGKSSFLFLLKILNPIIKTASSRLNAIF